MKTAVVTGVSTGIGKSIAIELARSGWRVFGSVRKEQDATRLREILQEAFVPLLFDIEDDEAVIRASEQVRRSLGGQTLNALVNNAGIAMPGPLLVQTVAAFRRQIEVNLVGSFAVTRAFAPLLGLEPALTGNRGRIINIGSTSGKMGLPYLGAYAASKHGLEGFSESLRRELRSAGIAVIVVAPGTVRTPIYEKAEASLDKQSIADTIWDTSFRKFMDFVGTEERRGIAPEEIALVVKHALTAPSPSIRYAPMAGKFFRWTLPSLLPKRLTDILISRQFGLTHE